jgi:hypothetical protein
VTDPGNGDPGHRWAVRDDTLPGEQLDGFAVRPVTPARPPGIDFVDPAGRILLSLRIEAGRLLADYQPADLDAAARLLAAAVARIRLAAGPLHPPPRFDGGQAGDLHRRVLGALDQVAAVAVDAGGIAPAGLWRPDVLEAGSGVVDAAEQLVFPDQGDPCQVQHAATWCPARILPLLTDRRAHLAAHAPDPDGCCTSCVAVPVAGMAGDAGSLAAPWPCDLYRSHLAGLPDLPAELTRDPR